MRVIITGGTGLIGSHLSASLAKDGHEVIVLSRSPEKKAGRIPQGAQAVAWDARSAEGWGHLADGADAIINLAGENLAGEGLLPSRWTPERRKRILESRLNAGRAVVEAVEAASTKPGVVIQASAVGYYGPSGDEIITEQDQAADDFLAKVTVEWEASTQPVEQHGVRRVVTRIGGIVLSPDSGALPPILLQYRLMAGGPLGTGRQWYSWIHPEDEVSAMRYFMTNDTTQGAYNLAAPNPLTNDDFGRTVGQVLNRPHWFPLPALPGMGLKLLFGDVSSVVLTGQRVVPARLLEEGFEFQFPDLKSALEDLLR